MMNLNSIITKFKEEEMVKDRQGEIEKEKWIKECLDHRDMFWESAGDLLMPATITIYKRWLCAYLNMGGKLTHYYNYTFQHVEDQWFYAISDIKISAPLYGSDSINIIIPENVRAFGSDLGHIVLYLEGRPLGKSIRGSKIVPLFNNIEF